MAERESGAFTPDLRLVGGTATLGPGTSVPLKDGDGGGTLPPMEVVDAKIAAAEARTDTKFAMMTGELAVHFGELKADLARKPGTGTLIGIAVAIVALLLTALAYGGDRLAMGVGLGDQRHEQMKRDEAQDARLAEILRRLPEPAPSASPQR